MPRRADQPGEHRRLTDRQVSRLLTEVKLRSLPDAEDTARASLSEIDLVQIRLEDLYLAVVKLHQQGHHRFGYFAFHGTRTGQDRKSTRLNSSHLGISYAVFCLKKKT